VKKSERRSQNCKKLRTNAPPPRIKGRKELTALLAHFCKALPALKIQSQTVFVKENYFRNSELKTPPRKTCTLANRENCTFPLKFFKNFCLEGTAITTSLHAFLFFVQLGVKFKNTHNCLHPLKFFDYFFSKNSLIIARGHGSIERTVSFVCFM
jgi:hypothetical protein